MAFTVNTNVLSLTAQNNLRKSQDQLNTAITRLSSGSKINSAKDNAAGQAIANRMTSQINGLNQASSNANDGISLAQTTEGALNQVNSNLQRIRSLTVQAQNGTNSSSDLKSIQAEINQRTAEINRISKQTAFNGTNVLDGSKNSISIQVGAQDNQTISINLQQTDTTSLKLGNLDVTNLAGKATASNYTVAGSAAASNASFSVTGTGASAGKSFDTSSLFTVGTTSYVSASDGSVYKANVTSSISAGATSIAVTVGATAVTNAAITSAVNPLHQIDTAISSIDSFRSDLGAVQNRLDSAINNISSTTTNLSSARSRIQDTNYASEVSTLSKAQILQQAGTSVLAQANKSSQGVLSLLQ